MWSLYSCCLVGFNPCWLRLSRLRGMIWNLKLPTGLIYQGFPDTFKSYKGMTNVNCHYGPPGNKGILPFGIGRKPFRLGEPCTDCNSGHGWCDNGLCIECPDKNCDCPIKVKLRFWFKKMILMFYFSVWTVVFWMLRTANATVRPAGMELLVNDLAIILIKNVALTLKVFLLIFAQYMEVDGFPKSFVIIGQGHGFSARDVTRVCQTSRNVNTSRHVLFHEVLTYSLRKSLIFYTKWYVE